MSLKWRVLIDFCLLSPGLKGGQAMRHHPLAQHHPEEEEDGSPTPSSAPALCLPAWSQALLSARKAPTDPKSVRCQRGVL